MGSDQRSAETERRAKIRQTLRDRGADARRAQRARDYLWMVGPLLRQISEAGDSLEVVGDDAKPDEPLVTRHGPRHFGIVVPVRTTTYRSGMVSSTPSPYDPRNLQSLFGYGRAAHVRSGGICQLCGCGKDRGLDFGEDTVR